MASTPKKLAFILFFLCVCLNAVLAADEVTDDDHFLGRYAFEVTPYWPEFEIVADSNGLMLKYPNSDEKMALMVSDGALIAKEDKGDEFKLSYDSSSQHYVRFMQVQTSTFSGLKRFPEKRTMIKLKSSPNDRLEKEYGIKAVDLVKNVRNSEDWIHQVKTFQAKATDKWTKTPEGIERYRKELEERHPDSEISSKRYTGLRPELEGEFEVVFNDSRFRTCNYTKEDSMSLRIWNGREFIAHEKYSHTIRNIMLSEKT